MYIEMIDETGQVSEKLKEQTLELLDFAAQRLGKEDKEMAVTFVTNERSHELNLEYRDTDRPTDVISLEYKPELDISFDEEELAENPELAEMMGEFDSYIGELFISVDKAHEQAEDYGHSFEREMGKIIGRLDLIASYTTERYRRAVIGYGQGLLAGPFMQFLPVR